MGHCYPQAGRLEPDRRVASTANPHDRGEWGVISLPSFSLATHLR